MTRLTPPFVQRIPSLRAHAPTARSLRRLLLAGLLAAPAPALAAEPPSAEAMRAQIEDCLQGSPDLQADSVCVGMPAESCMAIPENQTTLGMSACINAEADAWDQILNALWPEVKTQAAEFDAAERPQEMGLPRQSDSLLAAQRAWIAYRDAECLLAYAQGGIGSIRHNYGASCRLQMISDRALQFRDWLRPGP